MRLWLLQITIVLALAAFCAIVLSIDVALSILLGGLVAIIPNAYFASKLFKYEGARAARQIVSSFYKGEALKITLSALLFTAVFMFCHVVPLAFFASYILVLMTHWFAPWIIVNKQK